MATTSTRWTWTKADTHAWFSQAWKVLIPYILVIIPAIIGQLPKDWAYTAVVVYILNRVWDAVRRYYSQV